MYAPLPYSEPKPSVLQCTTSRHAHYVMRKILKNQQERAELQKRAESNLVKFEEARRSQIKHLTGEAKTRAEYELSKDILFRKHAIATHFLALQQASSSQLLALENKTPIPGHRERIVRRDTVLPYMQIQSRLYS